MTLSLSHVSLLFGDDEAPPSPIPPDPVVEAEIEAEAEAVEPVRLELAADAYEGDSTSSMDDCDRDGLW